MRASRGLKWENKNVQAEKVYCEFQIESKHQILYSEN